MRGLVRANAAITAMEKAGAWIAGAAIFVVMSIVVVDVARRYLLNKPLPWSYDLISIYLLPLLFFPVLSDTFRLNHHVAVDILYLRMGRTRQRLCRLLTTLTATIVFVPIAWLALDKAGKSYASGDVLAGTVPWPTWIPPAILAVGFGLLVVRLVLDAVALAASLVGGTPDVPGESPERDKLPDWAAEV